MAGSGTWVGCIEEKKILLNRGKKLHLVMAEHYLHQSYSRAERLKYRAPKEELKVRKHVAEKDLVIKNRTITVRTFPTK